MKVKIEFVAYLNLKNIENKSWIELENPISITNFLESQGIKPAQQKYIIPTVNKCPVKHDYVLQNEDELFLYLPVGGG